MKTRVFFILIGLTMCPAMKAQSVTVTADGPDDSVSQAYMALDRDCKSLINKQADPVDAVAACKKVADEVDKFAPESHFITRRAAYVFYTIALVRARKSQDALTVGNKAVAVVMLGHDDESGLSAAYYVRAQARVLGGDLAGADQDLEKAESYERDALRGPAGQSLNAEYTNVLKRLLGFHAQVLSALGKQNAADAKLLQASKL
jgi:hypothetical protein